MQLGALKESIDGLVSAGPSAFGDADSMEALHREMARLEAVVTAASACFDTGGDWAVDGAQTAAAWLATRCHLPGGVARRRVRLGRTLRDLPVCAKAWMAGEINVAHVSAIANVRRPATEEALARDEELLVDDARQFRFEGFARLLAYWEQHADPDGSEDAEDRRSERRGVHLSESFDGMWFGKMTLDPISGAIVNDELRRLERELFEADWARARTEKGTEPTIADLARTPAQRRADALVEMATRSRIAPAGGRRPAPLFSVLVGYETLHGRICELANGTVVAPGALVPWLDQAYVERVVFGLDGRIDVSATARLFTGATRRAIEIRDRGCTHDYCDRTPDECQGDHVVPYAANGPTTQDNGQLLCGFHNRLRQPRPPPRSA
jgi:uncharacterized protein DUF222/HNH endonuclease